MLKVKDKKNLKSSKEKSNLLCKGYPIRISADFLVEMLYARREYHDIQSAKRKKKKKPTNLPTNNSPPYKVLIQNWRRNKCFSDKQKIKEFIFIKLNQNKINASSLKLNAVHGITKSIWLRNWAATISLNWSY